jgi:putative restriction endonuclease
MRELGDYLDLTLAQAQQQWKSALSRVPAKRQVPFEPIETLLSLGASFLVNHRHYGGSTAQRAVSPIPELATLFRRPNSSILAKMANLDGSRPNGAKHDLLAGTRLRERPDDYARIYRTIFATARVVGIARDQLPDFLGLEGGGSLFLRGQDELEASVVEEALSGEVRRWAEVRPDLTAAETERLLVARTRVGQHVFASQVLDNCGHKCVFCGLELGKAAAPRMLVASHIKPWKDSSARERLDHRNGLAACPIHDVAFDAGLITVNGGLRIHVSEKLQKGMLDDPVASSYFARPPLRDTILLPASADHPGSDYLNWHKNRIFEPA